MDKNFNCNATDNVIKCPECEGVGKVYDGICDYPVITCEFCKGKGKVIPRVKTIIVLEPIE